MSCARSREVSGSAWPIRPALPQGTLAQGEYGRGVCGEELRGALHGCTDCSVPNFTPMSHVLGMVMPAEFPQRAYIWSLLHEATTGAS